MRILVVALAFLLLAGTHACSGPRAENTTAAPNQFAGPGSQQAEPAKVTEVDPVCGMEIDAAKTAFHSEYKGQTYHFCSDHCKRTFDSNPEVALNKQHNKM